jgi:hypothetical protein
MKQLQRATIAARKRTGRSVAVQANAGAVRVVTFERSTSEYGITPVSPWMTPDQAVRFLQQLC